jgi:expansin (peptidoglycan-binding protein)
MGNMTRASARDYFRGNAGAQLRGFDKTVNVSATVYVNQNYGGYNQGTAYGNRRYEYVNASNQVYNSQVYPNTTLIDATHLIDQALNAIQRTCDLIEGRLTDQYFDFRICHASCHYSCHGSRGRR